VAKEVLDEINETNDDKDDSFERDENNTSINISQSLGLGIRKKEILQNEDIISIRDASEE
jgi:hypothetical protein